MRITLERSRWGVSVALGHSSIKVTEKHYSRWVRARQEQLEADVRRGWGHCRSEGVAASLPCGEVRAFTT